MTPLLPVRSSMLSHIGYDPASRTFAARFNKSNFVHQYLDVPPEAANPVLDAARIEGASVGVAFNTHIKDKFQPGDLLEVDPEDIERPSADLREPQGTVLA